MVLYQRCRACTRSGRAQHFPSQIVEIIECLANIDAVANSLASTFNSAAAQPPTSCEEANGVRWNVLIEN